MNKIKPQHLAGKYPANSSFIIYVLLGFSVPYLLFFIRPVFLNPEHAMQFFIYLPVENPIGSDLKQALSHSEELFIAKKSPYTGSSLYTPLTYVLLAPLLAVSLPAAYGIITAINIICYIFIALLFPLWTNKQKPLSPLLMLFFITGLFSYGFQFELERGQFNVITMFFCLLAIWIYHYRHKYRYLAYLMFSVSIQLKIFPAIFIVMFIRDWRDWKNNIKRFLGLGVFNFALLFILGPKIFFDFLNAVKAQSVNPFAWIGNHSIRSFVGLVAGLPQAEKYAMWYFDTIQFILLAFVVVCIFLIMLQAYLKKQTGLNSYLLLACTIGALVIPPVSHDYTLSILIAAVATVFHNDCFAKIDSRHSRLLITILIFAFCAVYSSTLFSYVLKPHNLLLYNSFPALMVMLAITAAFSLMSKPSED